MTRRTSTFSQESGDLLLPLSGPAIGRCYSAKKSRGARPSSEKRGPASHNAQTLNSAEKTQPAGGTVSPSTCSQQEFLASQRVVPASREARAMTAGSGRKLSACLGKSDPLGRCLKTLLESSTWESTEFLLTWKGAATKCNRSLFRLVPSTPRSDERGSGSSAAGWSAPTATDGRRGNKPKRPHDTGNPLTQQIASWPTPTKRDDKGQTQNPERMDYVPNILKATWPSPQAADKSRGPEKPEEYMKGEHGRKLGSAMNLATWATPKSSQGGQDKARRDRKKSGGDDLVTQATEISSGPATSGCLALTENFVVRLTTLSAWLMGYTGAYLWHWEIRSSRRSPTKSSKR